MKRKSKNFELVALIWQEKYWSWGIWFLEYSWTEGRLWLRCRRETEESENTKIQSWAILPFKIGIRNRNISIYHAHRLKIHVLCEQNPRFTKLVTPQQLGSHCAYHLATKWNNTHDYLNEMSVLFCASEWVNVIRKPSERGFRSWQSERGVIRSNQPTQHTWWISYLFSNHSIREI